MLAASAFFALSQRAKAQDFPNKPLTTFVAYPPGGPTDLIARALSETMSERLGKPMIVDNRPGGGGQIAASAFLRLAADGHALLIGDTSTLGINKILYPNFGYDPLSDMVPVAPLMSMPIVFYVPKASPFNTVAEVVAGSKKQTLSFASQGSGSLGHLLGEMLKNASGGQFSHIPYKGTVPAINDLLGGQVDLMFDGVAAGLPYLLTQKLRALAVAGPARLPEMPDIPTMAELGFPTINLSLWLGVVARMGTPKSIVQRLNEEVSYAMKLPKTVKRFKDLGFQFMYMTPDEFKQFLKTESSRLATLLKAHRIVLE